MATSNKAPVVKFTITPASLILPANKFTLDLSKSTDVGRGRLTYLHSVATGAGVVLATPTKEKCTGTVPMVEGEYEFKGEVTDNKKLKSFKTLPLSVKFPPPPTANAGAAQTVQLPGALSLKGAGTGTGITAKWTGAGVIANGTLLETDVSGCVAGTSNYTLVVTDQFGRTATAVMAATILPIPPPPLPTKFGAHILGGTNQEKIAVLKALDVEYTRPNAVDIQKFDGKIKQLDDFDTAGFKNILCINWESNTEPIGFPTDLVEYRRLLKIFLAAYKGKIAIAVCENEPTTKKFFDGPTATMSNYSAELRVFVEECNNAGIPCTDGGIHVEYITQIMSGANGGNLDDVIQLIAAYKTIPLTYINIHTQGSGNSYPAGQLKKVADYIRKETGKPVASNEWHVENATPELIKNMVGQFKEAGFIFSAIWGTSKTGDTINKIDIPSELSDLGIAYRDAIK